MRQEAAARDGKQQRPETHYIQGDEEFLPFKPGSLDCKNLQSAAMLRIFCLDCCLLQHRCSTMQVLVCFRAKSTLKLFSHDCITRRLCVKECDACRTTLSLHDQQLRSLQCMHDRAKLLLSAYAKVLSNASYTHQVMLCM